MTVLPTAERFQSWQSLNPENLDSDSSRAPTGRAFAPGPIRQHPAAAQRFRGPFHQNRHLKKRGLRPLKWGVETPEMGGRDAKNTPSRSQHDREFTRDDHPGRIASNRSAARPPARPQPIPGSLDPLHCHGERRVAILLPWLGFLPQAAASRCDGRVASSLTATIE